MELRGKDVEVRADCDEGLNRVNFVYKERGKLFMGKNTVQLGAGGRGGMKVRENLKEVTKNVFILKSRP